MKNIILLTTFLLPITWGAIASTKDPGENTRTVFGTIFKGAGDIKWSEAGRNNDVTFTLNEVRTRATFDKRGKLVQMVRYFREDKLSPLVRAAVKSNYADKEIFGVTEISNSQGVNYRIVLKDDKHYLYINANNTGNTEMVAKYKRGDL